MNREQRAFIVWLSLVAAAIFLAVLAVYALVLIGQALFDGSRAEDDRYHACLDAGGSYENRVNDWACTVPIERGEHR